MNCVQHMKIAVTLMIASSLILGSCGQDSSSDVADSISDSKSATVSLPDGIFLNKAPEDATPIPDLKMTAKEGDEVLIHVVIGGRVRPFVDNRSIMMVVQATMSNPCNISGDHCKTPWDYCCTPTQTLTNNLATVQIIDAQGQPLKVNLETASPLKPMSTLRVQGIVGPRPDKQTLVVNATGIYIENAP